MEEVAVDKIEKEVADEIEYTVSPTDDNNSTSTDKQEDVNNDFTNGITKTTALTLALNNIQTNFASLLVGGEEEKVFYDRKVKPLLDEIYFLSIAAQGMSIAAQNFQSNAFVRKKQIKLSVDLTYDIIKEAYCVLDILKERNCIYRSIVENDLERCGGNPVNYSMDNNEYKDFDSKEGDINCDED
ncbi:hypothetical protein [Clostridium sp.]|uniref:hypothetical protein n=1 Tax=Clostridium sp. TaxID=1506 RepID=UPI00261F5760|nr:hypothetical protein [Clostridium sp.]